MFKNRIEKKKQQITQRFLKKETVFITLNNANFSDNILVRFSSKQNIHVTVAVDHLTTNTENVLSFSIFKVLLTTVSVDDKKIVNEDSETL